MADLASLLQYAPNTAAGFMGTNQAQEEELSRQRVAELVQLIQARTQDAQQKAAMNPYELERARLANATTDAALPGVTAASDLARTNAAKAQGTLQSDVDAGNTSNRMKIYQTVGQHLGSMSGAIDDNPGVSPHVTLAQQLDTTGIPDSAKQALLQKYANVPPAQLSAKMKADSAQLLRENSDYAAKMDERNAQEAGANSRNAATNANAKEMERMRIDAGKYNRKGTAVTVETALLKAPSAAAKAEILESAYNMTKENDPEAAADYLQRALAARQRAAEDAGNKGLAKPGIDVPGVSGLPPQARPEALAPVAPGAAVPQAATTAVAGIPQGAVQKLRANPGLRAAFDAKYGAGASVKVLGN